MRPLLRYLPALTGRVPWERLGELPTPVASLAATLRAEGIIGEGWVKRDDLTSPIYGGNKVRTLEVLFGDARREGATHVYATGAFGSNHAVATRLHAPRVGLTPGAVLWPQPYSEAARENLVAVHTGEGIVRGIGLVSLPWAYGTSFASVKRNHAKRGERAYVMAPGGATPLGALGYVSAGLELAEQVASGALPRPSRIVVGVGSNCTTAGLLVGTQYAADLRLGFVDQGGAPAPPTIVAVRVTPWPITSPVRVAWLARSTASLAAELAGDGKLALSYRKLRARLVVDGRFLGPGYGTPTEEGRTAIALFRETAGVTLDTTYSGKAAAGFLAAMRASPEPTVFWATKSSATLPFDVALPSLPWIERFVARHATEG